MSNVQTNWVLNLIDRITAPVKSIQQQAGGLTDAIEAVNSATESMGQSQQDALNDAKKSHAELTKLITKEEKEVQRLKDSLKAIENSDPLSRRPLELDLSNAQTRLRRYQEQVVEVQEELKELEKLPSPESAKVNWGAVAVAANQAWEIANKVVEAFDFGQEIADLQTSIQRLTGFTGDELESVVRQAWRIGRVFNEDAEEIARAANAMTQQIGGTFEENMRLIQMGFEKGANANGDMLDQLLEYGPQLKAAGIDAAQGLAIMIKAGKEGIFSDKAIDAIKEANLSLRELGQPQIDALNAIGLKVKDLAGKTSFEAIQMIVSSMEKASVQAKQMVIADIFKGAGEDAGMSFIEGLNSVDMDINNIPSVEQAGAGIKGFLADMQSWFATTFQGIASNVGTLGSIGAAITGFLPIIQALTKSQMVLSVANKVAAVSQNLLNAAFVASPIGWIVAGLAAVTAGVLYAWNHFEGFRKVVLGLWEVFKQVFNNIAGLFKAVFTPIGEAIQAIQEGRYMDAAKAAVKLNPVGMVARAVQYTASGGLTNGVADAWERGKSKGAKSWQSDQEKKKEPGLTVEGATGKNSKSDSATLDGKLFNNGKSKNSSGLDIQGSGGSKAITMNLDIKNYFNVDGSTDIRALADKITGVIVDRFRDALVTS